MLNRLHALAAAALVLASSAASASYLTYTSRGDFTATLGSSVTDDYSNAGYQFIQSDSAMSAVLGETDYHTTGFVNLNIVQGNDSYCAGCNGSYELSFLTTSVGDADGVFGVGFDITANSPQLPYWAHVTLGDGTLADFALPTGSGFFGITSASDIKSIHLGLQGGGSTTSGSFVIDNLTIGASGSDAPRGLPQNNIDGSNVPEPASLALVGLALAGAGRARRRQSRG